MLEQPTRSAEAKPFSVTSSTFDLRDGRFDDNFSAETARSAEVPFRGWFGKDIFWLEIDVPSTLLITQ